MATGREFIWVLLQLVFKQMMFLIINIQIFFLIKKYLVLHGEEYFCGEGLKKFEIHSWSWQNKETSYLMEYLCYIKSVLVYGCLIISKYNCHSFWFGLGMEKLMKVCERKDIPPFLASHHPPTYSPPSVILSGLVDSIVMCSPCVYLTGEIMGKRNTRYLNCVCCLFRFDYAV